MDLNDIKYLRNKLNIGLREAKELLLENGTVNSALMKWETTQAELLELEKNKKYIDFNDWFYIKDFFIECSQYFFNDNHTIPNRLKPLSENYSKQLWSEYISEKHRHLMMVKFDDNWKINKSESFSKEWDWCSSWDKDDYFAFEENVKHRLDWVDNDVIYFFWGRYTSVEISWETLCKYWIPFMYEDEMNIVLNPKSNKVLIIGVNGCVAVGYRKIELK